VTDPYPAPAEEPSSRSGCVTAVWFVGLFLLSFAVFGALVFLRAPDRDGSDPDGVSPLAEVVVAPPGYVLLQESVAGGGRLNESRTARQLSAASVPGFRDAILVSWGRPAGEPPRAVVTLAVQLDSPASAEAAMRSFKAVATSPDLEGFVTPEGWVGFHQAEESGRFAQRVAFTKGDRLFVVSVVTPRRTGDTAEVLAHAQRQAAR